MTTLLAIAFRNLLRAKRRTALAGGTMVLAGAALVLGNGLSAGITKQLTADLVSVRTGHLQVVARPNDFQPQNSPLDAYGLDPLPGAGALARQIEQEGAPLGVVKAVPYLNGRGNAVAATRTSLATIVGIDPEREPELRAALPPVVGTFLPKGDDRAVYVAAPVAHKLRIEAGDTVSFVIQTPRGAFHSLDAVVCGVFRKGAPWYDDTFYVSLAAAQSLFDFQDAATNIKITLSDGSRSSTLRAQAAIATMTGQPSGLARGTSLRVETLEQAGRFSFSIVQANETAIFILSAFLFLAATMGVVISLLLSVHERTCEIGTVRALGMRRRTVIRMLVLEGLALGVVSAVLGVALGSGVVQYYAARGIPMNTMTLAGMAGGDKLFPALDAGSAAWAGLAIGVLSTLAAVYPAITASRLEPREALRHV